MEITFKSIFNRDIILTKIIYASKISKISNNETMDNGENTNFQIDCLFFLAPFLINIHLSLLLLIFNYLASIEIIPKYTSINKTSLLVKKKLIPHYCKIISNINVSNVSITTFY